MTRVEERRFGGRRLAARAIALAAAVFPLGPTVASAQVAWLCHPEIADNPCEIPLDTTIRAPDGSERVETPRRPSLKRRRVDCFYVYPTVSNQPRPLATKSRDPELVSIANYQAAPFSSQCRMYAPIYRQRTVPALLTGSLLGPADREISYADVEEAFREYLRENRGRGVVLIGHSQGTFVLRTLIARVIDTNERLRKRLVGAVLMGGNVVVERGRVRGGDFRRVPLCRRRSQFGCVVAYSTFAEDPPANSRFGRVPASDPSGLPSGPRHGVACTDPARLSGIRRPVPLTLPTEPYAPGFIALTILQTYGGVIPKAPTTMHTTPERFQGSCRRINGAHVYRYDVVAGTWRPNPSPEPGWGTHLVDMNLGVERLVAIVRRQAKAWLRAPAGSRRGR